MNEVANQVKEQVKVIMARCAEKLVDLLAASVIISGTISIGLVYTCCKMWMEEIPVPTELLMALSTVLSLFLGARIGKNAAKAR